MACSFFIAMEYGISRPASSAFFVSKLGASYYPYAWLVGVPVNFFLIFLYNRFLPKMGCLAMMRLVIMLVMSIGLMTYLLVDRSEIAVFCHYIWKDIYILLMFKQLWSLIHSTVDTQKARYLYGLFFGIGGLGSVIGSALPGFFAVALGSKTLFLGTLPIYLLLGIFYQKALNESQVHFGFRDPFASPSNNPFSFIFQKRFLFYIASLVMFMQLSVAFVEYQFNYYLQTALPTLDLRTEYCGRLFSIINMLTTSFQMLGGFLLIQTLGISLSHKIIPLLFFLQAALFAVIPSFRMVSMSFVSVKSIDHSFFGIIREMLYIPLTKEEKFQAKAVIDVFIYRFAKAFAAILLILGEWIAPASILQVVQMGSFLVFGLWMFTTYKMFREKHLTSTLIASK